MSGPLPYKYICIEGNIGSGKTSLCDLLSRQHSCQLILEEFADNPFLPYFYENQERYAFPVELFFMTERHKQLQHTLLKPSLFADMFISDYVFWKTMIFAGRNLGTEEYRLLKNLFNILNNNFPAPELLVYLHRSPDKLLDNIRLRGRHYEQAITRDYLQGIQDSYFEFFRSQIAYPILILEVEHLDFVNNPDHFKEIHRLLKRKYLPGMHRIKMHL